MPRYLLDARTATDHFPGIGRYVSALARALAPLLAPDEELILLHDPARPSRWALPAVGAQVRLLPAGAGPFSPAQQWQMPSLLRRERADVYHSPYYLMPYRPGIPTVVTLYDLIPEQFPEVVSLRARLLFRIAMRLALRAADHVITISESTRRDLLARYRVRQQRLWVIPLAPDARFQPAGAEAIAAARRQYGLPQRFALYVGSNKPHKNLTRLVESWSLLGDQMGEEAPPLCIAGAWDARYPQPQERAEALQLGSRVRFLGPVAEEALPALYSGATLFVFPSLYEGFGLPVVEAMACGAPVACSRRASLTEVGGDAAVYFEPTATGEIAQAAGALLQDDVRRRRLAEQGKRQAASFSWRETAQRTLDCYRALAG
jgi:alpha-1,3-rhamnosyl/mannosyltransferase